MNNETPTPRTNAYFASKGKYWPDDADFARTLESGLNSIASMLGMTDETIDGFTTAEELIDAMQNVAAVRAEELAERTRERDEARLGHQIRVLTEPPHLEGLVVCYRCKGGEIELQTPCAERLRAQLEAVTATADMRQGQILSLREQTREKEGLVDYWSKNYYRMKIELTSALTEMTQRAEMAERRLALEGDASRDATEKLYSTQDALAEMTEMRDRWLFDAQQLQERLAEMTEQRDAWKQKYYDQLVRPDELVEECDRIKSQFLAMEERDVEQQDMIAALKRGRAQDIAELSETTKMLEEADAQLAAVEKELKRHQEIYGHICLPTEVPESYASVRAERDALKAKLAAAEKTGDWRHEQIAHLEAKLADAERERDDLAQWKSSQLAVESEWDAQEIAKLLGATLGQSGRRIIQERVPVLVAKLADAERELVSWRQDCCCEMKKERDNAEAKLAVAQQALEKVRNQITLPWEDRGECYNNRQIIDIIRTALAALGTAQSDKK